MGKLNRKGTIHITGTAASITEIVEDNKKVISWPIDVVEPNTVANKVTGAIVLDARAGQPFSTKGDVDATVDLVEGLEFSTQKTDLVEGIVNFSGDLAIQLENWTHGPEVATTAFSVVVHFVSVTNLATYHASRV